MNQLPAVLSNPTFTAFLRSEPLAVDLVNTRLFLEGGWVDLLDSRPQREEWLFTEVGHLGVREEDASAFTDAVVDDVRPVRTPATAQPRQPAPSPVSTAPCALRRPSRSCIGTATPWSP